MIKELTTICFLLYATHTNAANFPFPLKFYQFNTPAYQQIIEGNADWQEIEEEFEALELDLTFKEYLELTRRELVADTCTSNPKDVLTHPSFSGMPGNSFTLDTLVKGAEQELRIIASKTQEYLEFPYLECVLHLTHPVAGKMHNKAQEAIYSAIESGLEEKYFLDQEYHLGANVNNMRLWTIQQGLYNPERHRKLTRYAIDLTRDAVTVGSKEKTELMLGQLRDLTSSIGMTMYLISEGADSILSTTREGFAGKQEKILSGLDVLWQITFIYEGHEGAPKEK